MAQAKLKMFQCPSDTVNEPVTTGVIVAVHNMNGGGGTTPNTGFFAVVQFIIGVNLGRPDGRTNYVGIAGGVGEGTHAFWGNYKGLLTNRSEITLGQATALDGTSNTLMFGETIGGRGIGARDFARSWFGAGSMGTYRGLIRNGDTNAAHPGGGVFKLSSRHASGVVFCFGDCSTRTVRWTAGLTGTNPPPSWWLLQQIAGVKDGLNSDTAEILD
jgi:hypothetical protein